MKTLKLIVLAAFALLFSQCKMTQPTAPSGPTPSVAEEINILRKTQLKFYSLGQANLGSSPQQVIMLTAAWVRTQPNVQMVGVFDSTSLDIELKSGLHTAFSIGFTSPDGIALTRGGGHKNKPMRFGPADPAKHTLTNKNVLIYAPFIAGQTSDGFYSLYYEGEIDSVINIFKNQGFNVTLNFGDSATTEVINSFGNYGIVIIDTHGLPFGFNTDQVIPGTAYGDTVLNEVDAKELIDGAAGTGVYSAMQNGSICASMFAAIFNWQTFLKQPPNNHNLRLFITSKYIRELPPMPNTLIVGNFCYSGWAKIDSTHQDPIYNAFIDAQPLGYYYHGYFDGTSGIVANDFAKDMEDSLAQALAVYGDSTGFAYKMTDGTLYTPYKLFGGNDGKVFNHFGADDYSYMPCIDSFTDARDGQLYHTICIGNQIWMAQNLNYNAPGSFWYYNSPALGAIYGRLYPWNILMNGAGSSDANPSGVKGVCPYGWHIPSTAEWIQLRTALGGASNDATAMKLNSTNANIGGWVGDTTATNSSHFSALGSGYFFYKNTTKDDTLTFVAINYVALFHTSTLDPKTGVPGSIELIANNRKATYNSVVFSKTDPNQPASNASCRCVKDN